MSEVAVTEAELTGGKGAITAHTGDRFDWWDGTTWEVIGFHGGAIYSPSGLGGCPIVTCRHISGELPPAMAACTDPDGLCDWCGDSVATALINSQKPPADEGVLSRHLEWIRNEIKANPDVD